MTSAPFSEPQPLELDRDHIDSLQPDTSFPIVGVAASAGGLEAFTQLLAHLPIDTGMAFVLIQHLEPDRASLLAGILARVTKMLVCEVQQGMRVEANQVYVIPPNAKMLLANGVLELSPREKVLGKYMPGDAFFTALAADSLTERHGHRGYQAIAVVLSGGDGDGSLGLAAIKAAGGVTFAQCEDTAKFDSMPNTAVATGNVDFILTPEQIAAELVKLSRNPMWTSPQPLISTEELLEPQAVLVTIFSLLRSTTGVDFSHYKPKTLDRRIQRRMLLCKLEKLADYAAYLQAHPAEVKALHEEILIHVTSFFRDPEAFELLKNKVFQTITQHKSVELPIRIWVAGCSTGEEVYSIAICLLEFLTERVTQPPIQIFATDISELSIDRARAGIYTENQMVDVSIERRRRFFYPVEDGYQISKTVRELCVFARQDLSSDPPFSNVDLISCRNVLIYLGDTLQQRIIPIFHYSLNGTGFLLLGTSESTGKLADLFTVIDKKHRIYRKNPTASQSTFSFTPSSYPTIKVLDKLGHQQSIPAAAQGFDLQEKIDRLIADRYTPVGVVVDDKMQVLQLRGEIDRYLKLVSGVANLNLFNLVKSGLLIELRAAISQAQKQNLPVTKNGLRLEEGDRSSSFNLQVIPFNIPAVAERRFLVLFEDAPMVSFTNSRQIDSTIFSDDLAQENLQIKQELVSAIQERTATQEYLRAVIQEQEYSNQDLKVANEEILSSNEELQSTNEELETAKEEIQATNEELNTTNDELRRRNSELDLVNNDLTNLLASINIPILMLTNDLRIRRFTPMAQKLFNFIPGDAGRPLSDIRTNLNLPDLDPLILEVLDTLCVKELEVQTQAGYWYTLRIRPYRTTEQRIDGVVLVLLDIDALKRSAAIVEAACQAAETANRAKDDFLSNLSHELRNPLTAIIGWAQLIQSHKIDAGKIDRGLEVIYRSAKAQSQLIEDMLDLARIASGKLHLNLVKLDLVSVVNVAIESVELAAKAKSIEISSNLTPIKISGDIDRLGQVLWNLLANAIKFTPTGGRINITLTTVQPYAQICVSDNGQGMGAELLLHIFDRFHQGDSSSSKSSHGLGLGLSIVQHIVELHGGNIHAESAGEGQGTSLIIQLPLDHTLDLDQIGAEPVKANIQSVSALAGLRILVVDDELDILDLIKYILETAGAAVTITSSVKEAIAALTNSAAHYDALLADIGMPEADGFALIQQVRALTADLGGQIPAAAITAYVSDRDRQLAIDAGFQVHLAKPIYPDQLIQMVATLTGRVDADITPIES
jgi:chemotaxis methyl-accepting protein methylase/signal transduction histidine kinase/ActR/RegA family two-component response regulator